MKYSRDGAISFTEYLERLRQDNPERADHLARYKPKVGDAKPEPDTPADLFDDTTQETF